MTFYHHQVQKLTHEIYPKDHITEQVIRSKHFIDAHFSENLTLEQVAREVYLSKFHFIRLFKKYYGQTPYQYLSGVRIAKAKKLLQQGLSVSETCYALGFESLSSFTAFFKKTGGSVPIAYQRKKSNFKEMILNFTADFCAYNR